jgi:hypothetical protein
MVKDKIASDFYMNCKVLKRGFVVDVSPDGTKWGTDDLAFPYFRILQVPNRSTLELSGLMSPERDVDSQNPSRTLQCRAFRLDLDNPLVDSAGLRDFFDDHSVVSTGTSGMVESTSLHDSLRRTLPSKATHVGPTVRKHCVTTVDGSLIDSITVKNDPITDPAIIGLASTVIG